MRHGFLGSIGALLAGAGLAWGQLPPTSEPAAGKSAAANAPSTLPDPTSLAPSDQVKSPASIPPPSASPAVSPAPAVNGVVPAAACVPAPAPEDQACRPDGPGELPPECAKEEEDCCCHGWVTGEYMLWKIKNGPLSVPLATTSSPASMGVLTAPDTTVLLGQMSLDYHNFSSGRWTAGIGGPQELLGFEISGFFLEKRSVNLFPAISDANGSPLIARPVIDATTGMETDFLVAAPGAFAGNIGVSASSRMWGTEINTYGSLYRSLRFNADMLLGFRFLELEESLDVVQNTTILPGGTASLNGNVLSPGTNLTITDHFGTRNDFYGGQIGTQAEVRIGKLLFVYLLGKLALGTNHELINNTGSTSQLLMGSPLVTVPGGLLVVGSNSGRFSQDQFCVIPEAGINLGCQITKHICASIGYTFIYWSDVVRPGDQIDRVVNPGLVPTSAAFGTTSIPARPAVLFSHTDFWAYGVSAGLSIRF